MIIPSAIRAGGRAMSRAMGEALPPYRPETNRLVHAMGSPKPSPAHQRALNTAFASLKDAGLTVKMDMLHVMGQLTSAQATPNWIAPGFGDLTPSGGPTFTAKQGFTGNPASSAFLNSNVAVTSLPLYAQNNAHVAVWVVNDVSETAFAVSTSGDTILRLDTKTAGGALGVRLNTSTTTSIAAVGGPGFFVISRSGAAGYEIYKNGVALTPAVQASTGVPAGTFCYLRGQTFYASDQVFMGSCGSSLTAGNVSDYYTIMSALKAAIEAL